MADAQYRKEKPLDKEKRSLVSSFDKTNLDLESPKAVGGPNRTNSNQVASGQFTTPIPGNYPWQSPSNLSSGVLKNKEGENVVNQLHRWTPNKTYLDSFNPDGVSNP